MRVANEHVVFDRRPLGWKSRIKTQVLPVIAHANETVHEASPHSTGRGNVNSVRSVVMGISQVAEERVEKIAHRHLLMANFCRHHRLDYRRQTRITGGDGVVILKVSKLDSLGELISLQEQSQHNVCLLEYLESVDHQRVIMQQQRPLVIRGVLEVPKLT